MDDAVEGANARAVIPTNTTSDGEVVSSTCALCREGGNLTARPLGNNSLSYIPNSSQTHTKLSANKFNRSRSLCPALSSVGPLKVGPRGETRTH